MRQCLAILALTCASLSAQNAPVKARGFANAPIMMEVYSDYQCPYCKDLYEKTLTPLMAEYVDKGKVYLIHRELPNPSLHPHAVEAACYASAANHVGKYEQATEILFRDQEQWAVSGKVDETVCRILSPEEAKKVRALAKDPNILAEVQRDVDAARAAHIETTPTVFVTFRLKQYPIPGAVSYSMLRRFIDQLLSTN